MAIVFLKERCVASYDVSAIALIMIGSAGIILTANFQEVDLSPNRVKECLTSPKSIVYYVTTLILMKVTLVIVNR